MAQALGMARFETPLGVMGLVWSEVGLVATVLPEPRGENTLRRMRRRFPHVPELPPPPRVQGAIDAIAELLRGARRDLREIALDLGDVPELHRRIYEVARTIAPGRTLSYGEIAERLGDKGLAREVGAAMARNRFAIVVPCHRVLGADGKLGGFSAPGGLETKLRLLSIEGVQMPGTLPLFASADPDRG
jgi:methylated-DNA-[protein]-cysteine S-methyltransferase